MSKIFIISLIALWIICSAETIGEALDLKANGHDYRSKLISAIASLAVSIPVAFYYFWYYLK